MLRQEYTDALKTAMLAKDEATTGTVRLIIAEMKKRDIEARPKGNMDGISDDELRSMMQGMIKQRRESITMYEKGNRTDLAKKEADEITVIERFLPKQLSSEETTAAIRKTIADTGASGIKDMGKVMAELKKNFAGQIDFAQAGPLVKSQLGG